MAYKEHIQPEILPISPTLRLRKYDGHYEVFLQGYQDPFVYQNSEGIFDESKIPTLDYVKGMCNYLAKAGELYYIEILEDGHFVPVGDVTLKEENPPIAIWRGDCRGKGIGKQVMLAIINRLRELGCKKITDSTVYRWNTASQHLHESLGFRKANENERELFYDLDL